MTNRFTTLAAAAALFIGLSGPAAAGDLVPLGTAGGWKITRGEYPDKTGVCMAEREFVNDTSLAFLMSSTGVAKGRFSIQVGNHRWKIPKGDYPVIASVDQTEPVTIDGFGDGWLVGIQWVLNEAEVNLMSYGKIFHVTIGSVAYAYRLDGSGEMLQALTKCVRDLNPYATSANPFSETASNPYRRM